MIEMEITSTNIHKGIEREIEVTEKSEFRTPMIIGRFNSCIDIDSETAEDK